MILDDRISHDIRLLSERKLWVSAQQLLRGKNILSPKVLSARLRLRLTQERQGGESHTQWRMRRESTQTWPFRRRSGNPRCVYIRLPELRRRGYGVGMWKEGLRLTGSSLKSQCWLNACWALRNNVTQRTSIKQALPGPSRSARPGSY